MAQELPIIRDHYFGIGIFNPRTEENIGTLWRSAYIFGASYIFTIGRKYKQQVSDTSHTWRKIPLFHFENFDKFFESIPYSAKLIALEQTENSIPIAKFEHPDRAIYLLGSEDMGLSAKMLEKCNTIIELPGDSSLNVAVAGSITMFDRVNRISDTL